MKQFLLILFMVLFFQGSAQINLFMPEPYGDNFIESELIQEVSFVPLEIERYGEIMPDYEMKVDNENYFILDDRKTQSIYRFGKDGKLLNKINETEELTAEGVPVLKNPIKFSLNSFKEQINIYNFENSEILSYAYNGSLVSKVKIDYSPSDFIQDRNGDYWLYMGWNNPETQFRLLKTDAKGNLLDRKMRLISRCTPTHGFSFYAVDNKILYWELLGNAVYELVGDNIIPKYIFNYNAYQLPRDYHEMLAEESYPLIYQSGYYSIKKYLENDDFSYFFLNFMSENQREMFHLIYDRNTNELYIYSENSGIGAFDKAQSLTKDNELVFLVLPRRLRQLLRSADFVPAPFADMEDSLGNQRNPVVLKVRLNSLSNEYIPDEQVSPADTLFFGN